MEVHRQQCQACHSTDVRNILVRKQGEATAVYVRCSRCGELVARYQLQAYYHHGKGVESFLRSIGASAGESGREALADFTRVQKEALEGFEQALVTLKEQGKEV